MRSLVLTLSVLALLGAASLGWAASTDSTDEQAGSVVAEIDGRKITLGQVQQNQPDEWEKANSGLLRARFEFYREEHDAVEKQIDDQLLQDEAKKEHLTVDELLKRHISDKVKPPAEEFLRLYYLAAKTSVPYEQVKDRIIDNVRQLQEAEVRKEYLESLRSKNHIVVTLMPPHEDVALGVTPAEGPVDAPITVVEFADYQCPYCRQMEPTVSRLREQYKDKIRYSFRDFPLPMHNFAQKAAEASRCAADQGKYWQYHNLLFADNADLAVPGLKTLARQVNLDGDKFDKCLDSGAEAATVAKDLQTGKTLGINGTPTIFVNGYVLSGSVPYDALRELVDGQFHPGVSLNDKQPSNSATAARVVDHGRPTRLGCARPAGRAITASKTNDSNGLCEIEVD